MNWFKSYRKFFYSYKGYSAAGVECFHGQAVCEIANPINYENLLPDIQELALEYAKSLNKRVDQIHLIALNEV